MEFANHSNQSDDRLLGGLVVFGSIVLGTMAVLLFQSDKPTTPLLPNWSLRIEKAIRDGKGDELLSELDAAIAKSSDTPELFLHRGSLRFRLAKISESIADFDRFLELQPSERPYLWQRGISLYYAGKFQEGKEQFEIHRTVNPNDVENAFWHFLCAAKIDGVETAAKDILIAGYDRREPLMTVQKMIAGKATPLDVQKAIDAGGISTQFYGHLYLGLYADAKGNSEDCKSHLQKCVEVDFPGYMQDVAKVHLELLNSENPIKSESTLNSESSPKLEGKDKLKTK